MYRNGKGHVQHGRDSGTSASTQMERRRHSSVKRSRTRDATDAPHPRPKTRRRRHRGRRNQTPCRRRRRSASIARSRSPTASRRHLYRRRRATARQQRHGLPMASCKDHENINMAKLLMNRNELAADGDHACSGTSSTQGMQIQAMRLPRRVAVARVAPVRPGCAFARSATAQLRLPYVATL